jgi:alpha-D-ribose 1-methylphosphonate 5-triphosphate synthase subunit PhnG
MEKNATLTKMDQTAIKALHDLISQEEIRILKKPTPGLLMMTVKDSFETDFYLGEILVTEAIVEFQECKGYGLVMGDEPERAYLAASLETIFQSDQQELIRSLTDFLALQAGKQAEKEEQEKNLIARTAVRFESMVKG